MASVCLLMIATNKYVKFVKPLWDSATKHFLYGHDVKGLLFSNQSEEELAKVVDIEDIKVSHIDHEPWPMMTLKRFHFFLKEKEYLEKNFDYVFYCDVDMLFVADVGDEILPTGNNIVATVHPGFFDKPRALWTYETRPESMAYIPPEQGQFYVAGGFQGGTTEAYLKASESIVERIEKDFENDLIAVWHDESHWNRYVTMEANGVKFIPPSYCYPESWNIPWQKKLLALDKNHEEVRSES